MDTVARRTFYLVRRRLAAGMGRPVVLVAVFAAGVVLLAACGGTPTAASRSSSTTTQSTTSTSTSSPGQATAVLAGYRSAWHAFEHALADANPNDPLLTATMVDPQLQGVKANLLADQRQGIVGQGATTLHPKVESLSKTTATVVDCVHSATELVYAKSKQPVPPVTPPENDGVTATLVMANGTWKLQKQTVTDGKCAPGS